MTGRHSYDVTVAVTYYSPYVSGLTEVARVEAEGLAARGHRIRVLTNRHDPALPIHERLDGVDVVRCPVWLRHGRGIASPWFVPGAVRMAATSSALHLHAPMLEAGLIARLAAARAHVVLTHHIDLWVPPTLTSPAAVAATNLSTATAIRSAATTVVNSHDQAAGSRFWARLQPANLKPIPAPCTDRSGGRPCYRDGNGPHYGFLGRVVPDKGLAYLLNAFAAIADPDARLLIGGEHSSVAGGGILGQLQAAIRRDPRVRILGPLQGRELNDFYASIDVFTLPSVAESFGIAQAEAIMLGIPSVTSDLPGGRYPVTRTGLGLLAPSGNVPALTDALLLAPGAFSTGERHRAARLARTEFNTTRFLDATERVLQLNEPAEAHDTLTSSPTNARVNRDQ